MERLKQMFKKIWRSQQELSPIGKAVDILNKSISQLILNDKYEDSALLRCSHALIDYAKDQQEALLAGEELVKLIEEGSSAVNQLLVFKTLLAKLDMAGYIPFEEMPDFPRRKPNLLS